MSERFLANENFPRETVDWSRERGDDVVHAANVLVGAPDTDILRFAITEDRVLLTFDRDSGELLFHERRPTPGHYWHAPLAENG